MIGFGQEADITGTRDTGVIHVQDTVGTRDIGTTYVVDTDGRKVGGAGKCADLPMCECANSLVSS